MDDVLPSKIHGRLRHKFIHVDETSRQLPEEEGVVCESRAISKSVETLIGLESSLLACIMILCVLFTNRAGNVLLERFHGLPAEERLHWRSFLVKLTMENLKTSRDDEVFVASHKSVFIVYTVIGDICIFAVGKEVYDELALMEVLNAVSASVKEVCKKAPSERLFLEKYGKVCLCLDEIVSQGSLEHTDKDRIRRLSRLKPLAES